MTDKETPKAKTAPTCSNAYAPVRDIEIRLADHRTARVLQINAKFPTGEFNADRPAVRARLLDDFEKLVDTLLR